MTAPVVHNLSGEKEQLTLKLNKKIILEASASIYDQQRIIIFTFPASGRLDNKSEDG